MREIKFRAWDKKENKMYYDAQDTYDYMCNRKGCLEENFGDVLKDDRYVVMQYTGVNDANGSRIYEGDIVKMIGYKHKGVVKYINGAFIINWNNEYLNGSLYFWNNNQSSIGVIGNIFENKESLDE